MEPGTLHAPDVAVGNVADEPGWVTGKAPPLAVEYADTGQDEAELSVLVEADAEPPLLSLSTERRPSQYDLLELVVTSSEELTSPPRIDVSGTELEATQRDDST